MLVDSPSCARLRPRIESTHSTQNVPMKKLDKGQPVVRGSRISAHPQVLAAKRDEDKVEVKLNSAERS